MAVAMPSGAASRAGQPRRAPRRIGCSTSTYDTTAAPSVTATTSVSLAAPSSPVRPGVSQTCTGQCQR